MAVSKTTIEREALSKAISPQRDRAYEIHALTSRRLLRRQGGES